MDRMSIGELADLEQMVIYYARGAWNDAVLFYGIGDERWGDYCASRVVCAKSILDKIVATGPGARQGGR